MPINEYAGSAVGAKLAFFDIGSGGDVREEFACMLCIFCSLFFIA
jgi:hypothetical protein